MTAASVHDCRTPSDDVGDVGEDPDRELDLERFVAGFYAGFDNRNGRRPDASALLAMFMPTALVTKVDGALVHSWTREEFVVPRAELLTGARLTDFHEWECEEHTIVTCRQALRWSRFGKHGLLDGAEWAGGGHKFMRLRRSGSGWLIETILWEDL